MSETFRIKIDGLKDGSIRDQVVYQLVILFKRSQNDVQRILDNKGMVVKKGLELQAAIKYKVAIEQCGCACLIEPEQEPAPPVARDAEPFLDDQPVVTEASTNKMTGLTLVEHEPEPAAPEDKPVPLVAKVAETKKTTEKVTTTVSNEIGTTTNGDPFLVKTPQSFCCNCGEASDIATIETEFYKQLVYSTRFEKDKAILLALPYCPNCADSVGQYPMSSGLKWLLAFCAWFGVFFLMMSQINPAQHNLFVRLLFLLLPIVPAVVLFKWIGRPKAPKTSNCTPVIIKEFSRNPNSTRNEGRAMLIASAIAALLGTIFKRLTNADSDRIKLISMRFSNRAYEKEFKKNNKSFIKDGFIKIL
jgi:hypothetical protein